MVDLQIGLPLFQQQLLALLKKNLLLSWRNKRATIMQLLSSLFFLFLIFCIKEADNARTALFTQRQSIRDPKPLVFPSIPPCEDKFFTKKPCFDFLWSGNSSARLQGIVNSIMANNPDRPIPPTKVMSFRTADEVDAWLYSNPQRCPGVLHFEERNSTVISYGIQTNSTAVAKRGQTEDPTFKFQIPLQIAAEREVARSLIGEPNFSWVVEFKEFAHPATFESSILDLAYPIFFLAIAMFGFVFQISSLIAEKELKLRQAMSMMGLYDSAYWFSWLIWEGVVALISSLFIVLFGMMFQLDFFLKNNFLVVYLVFFLFLVNMTGFAFMLSAFFSNSSSATTVGFSVFIVGFVTQFLSAPIYTESISKNIRIIWSFFPPNLLGKALQLLSAATSSGDAGVSWNRRAKCAPNDTACVITINDIYIWLLGTFVLWFVLAIYFDNIFPNASGVRKSVLYFLWPGYWTGKGGSKIKEGRICSCIGSLPQEEIIAADDEDVIEEENVVKQQIREGSVDSNVAVQIRGLAKTYAGTTECGCCFKCKRTPPYHALKGLWVNFAKNQLFCLLGPNGAGKTTAINCLTGITPVTSGDALIYGYSIQSSIGMSNIQKMIGVCPQFDILWEALSGQEHLHLFASIKGLPPASIKSVAEMSLEKVKLTQAAKMRAGSYSGGMKRRLSIAIALIGDPKLIILDEPTTGVDPITRRHVWDIIEDAKKGRAIILTTHSMEEADILGDRIGIMAKGRLRCIGNSIRLKSRFGTGFVANVSFSGINNIQSPAHGDAVVTTQHHEAVKQFFKKHLDVQPKEEKAFLTFVIPHDREGLLTEFFTELQNREKEFGIADIQLSLATLEEVFLNIARQAELESAAAEGRLVTLTLTSGALVEIPVGARFVGIPGTESVENPQGIMVEVYWEQDDTGALCISGHSPEMPIPPNVPPVSSSASFRRTPSGQRGPIQGIVIDPERISASNL
ncbi:ABC_tran domain-containing protein/ABC2_membrane_3 domain-containing protein [Cephalotus follicularis]|uniref:ABC_tran domain-containing protein/ABC2_membrane_3 domain-containing protein n=1 Tax=Cephalotus follicularis TaxID=3775 RepID=A0A1Q3CA25_CEPFO|nr:ABC_tran domain-containing protein/ABC2_membrane_3 domain-containing protein [Cephalotus follicularis]